MHIRNVHLFVQQMSLIYSDLQIYTLDKRRLSDLSLSLPQSQLGAMISMEPNVLEACGGFIPDTGDLKTLLLHQQAKGLLGVKGIF